MKKLFFIFLLSFLYTACNEYEEQENKESILYALKSKLGRAEHNIIENKKSSSQASLPKPKGEVLFATQTDNERSFSYGNNAQSTGEIKLIHIPVRNGDITEIYDGAFNNIRIIKQAQKAYLEQHGSYTYDLSALNLAFEDVSQQYYLKNTQRIYLNNGYYYVLSDKLVAVYENNTMYHLDFYYDGPVNCISKMRSMDAVCEDLGGITPVPNKRIASWVSYSLPESLL